MTPREVERRFQATVEKVEEETGVALSSLLNDFSSSTAWILVCVKQPADTVDLRKVTGKLTRAIRDAFPGAAIEREGSPVKTYWDKVLVCAGDPVWEDNSYLFVFYGYDEYRLPEDEEE